VATKRKRKGKWAYRVRRAGLIPKPIYLTFDSEQEGDEYVARLEALLDRGIVPPDLIDERSRAGERLHGAIRAYKSSVSIADVDVSILKIIITRVPDLALKDLSFAWAQAWITSLKRVHGLAPNTIRHHVGALARCLDWLAAHGDLIANPLRMLARGYSRYSADDGSAAGGAKLDSERDRRLEPGEEDRIRAVLAGEKREDRERPLELREQAALVLLFDLALETAMRMREMYTLDVAQIDLGKRTVFLDKTKNGSKRQVPLSSVALARLRDHVGDQRSGLLFPWWDGDRKSLLRTTSQLSRQWSRVFEYAKCVDLHFHDMRHEATSRLFERTNLSDVEIAKISGHSSTRMLMRYANLRGSNLADHLWTVILAAIPFCGLGLANEALVNIACV